MNQSDGVLPCFQRPLVNATRPLVSQVPLNLRYVVPMLRLSDDEFPISIEERARRDRASMLKLGITTPGVREP